MGSKLSGKDQICQAVWPREVVQLIGQLGRQIYKIAASRAENPGSAPEIIHLNVNLLRLVPQDAPTAGALQNSAQ